jgi:hypothetical protein
MNGEDVRIAKNGHEDIRDEEHKNELNPENMQNHDEGSDIDESPSKPTVSSPPQTPAPKNSKNYRANLPTIEEFLDKYCPDYES